MNQRLAARPLYAGPRRLASLVAGPEDGPAVLLLPGYTGSKEDFAPVLEPIGSAGFRVSAIDLPGQYESPGTDDYSVDGLGDVVAGLAEVLAGGARVHLLGHSFGGLVARAAVLRNPDCFASLTLLDSGPAAIEGARRDRLERLRPLRPLGLAAIYEAMQALDVERGRPQPRPPVAAFLRKRFLASDEAGLFGMAESVLEEPDRVEALTAAGVATLVVSGVDDDAWPVPVQATMAARLGARHVLIPNAAHSPAVENPVATAAALVEFWRSR